MTKFLQDGQGAVKQAILYADRSCMTTVFFAKLTLHLAGSGSIVQLVSHPTREPEVLGSIPGPATYFRFSFRSFKKGSCQLMAKVCAGSTGYRLRRSKPAHEKCG